MFKNVASQKLTVFAFDSTTGLPKSGDAANITAYVDKDDGGVTVLIDTSATEKDATNAKGYYIFDLAQAETNGDKLLFSGKSSTANIVVLACPAVVYTTPANFTTFAIDGSGRTDVGKALGQAVTLDANNMLNVSTKYVGGTLQTAADLGVGALSAAQKDTIPTSGTIPITTTVMPDTAGTGTLLTRLSSARAGYLDNLNVGGVVASHADVLAINTSSSKHIILQTVGQYERPESGSTVYTVEARTFSAADGSAVNADSTPTFTATGQTSGSLAANLSAVSNPATGVYRATYTVASNATTEPVRFDVSAVISAATFTLSTYTQIVDEVSQTWTATDASHLTAIYNKLPSKSYLTGTNNSDGDVQLDEATGIVARVTLVDTTTTTEQLTNNNDKTGYALTSPYDPAKTAATQASVDGVATSLAGLLTTAMTESYATAGQPPSPAQVLFLVQQMLTEFAIAGTTLTVKKLDHSTAAIFTLDDANNPTSLTRTT